MKHYLAICIFLVIASGCKKEDDKNEPVDACSGITCQNGGTCVDGTCNCPPGYSGILCETQMEPQTMIIQNIRVLTFPETDSNGIAWDPFDTADIYVCSSYGSNCSCTFETDIYYPNANSPGTYDFDVYWVVSDPGAYRGVCLYDFDTLDGDDLMGGVGFIPADYSPGWPTEFTISAGDFEMVLTVEWEW